MTELASTIDTYLSAWNEPDAERRAALVARAWVAGGLLVDPPIEGEGHAGITEMMAALHSHYPGHKFTRTSGVDTHHNYARFAWDLVSPAGEMALSGIDIVEVGDDGRLARVTGFFGPLPAREAV